MPKKTAAQSLYERDCAEKRAKIREQDREREKVDPEYKAYMDYVWFEVKRLEKVEERNKKRRIIKNCPTLAYESMRFIHLPINFSDKHTFYEDYQAVGQRLHPDYWKILSRKLAPLNHFLPKDIIEEPKFCCPKPLAQRTHPNPEYETYKKEIERILAGENEKLAEV